MRKLLLNPTPLFRKLRLLSMLLTLLLALPQTAMGDDTTTYTFTGTSEISDHTGTATSTVAGAGSNTWSIKNFYITKGNLAQDITPTAISNTLGYSNIGYSDCIADLTIESDFGITGSFVSATINYATSGLSSGEVQVYKTSTYNEPLSTGSGDSGKTTMDLSKGSVTLNLDNSYQDRKVFIDNHISFHFTFNPENSSSYFEIQSITITTSPVSTYDLYIAGTQVTSVNASNILGNGTVSFTPGTGSAYGTLTFNNASIEYAGHCIKSGIGLNINATGTNTITCTGDGNYPFYSEEGADFVFDGYFNATIQGNKTENQSAFSPKCTPIFRTANGYGPQVYYPTNTSYKIFKSTNLPLDFNIGGNYITEENKGNIYGDNSASLDTDNNILTLNGANIGTINYGESFSNLTINLTGKNVITKNSYLIYYNCDESTDESTITFTGNGELWLQDDDITSDNYETYAFIEAYNEATVNYSDNFGTGGWTKTFVSTAQSTDGKAYLKISRATSTNYGITVAGTQVTSDNATTGITAGSGKVYYDAENNILTLDGASITTGGIVSSIGDLTINLKGANNIGDNSTNIATGISSSNDGTLTFKMDSSDSRLSFNTTTSAVSGFADVTLDTGTYLMYQTNGVPAKYDTNSKNYYTQSGSTGIVKLMQVTSEAYYPLWVNGAQVSHLTSGTQFTFNAATNTLALTSAWISAGIVSGLDNLIITLNGNNNNIQLTDTTAAIRSINPAATLTIQKSASAENGSLNMKNNVDDASSSPVIKNFASVSHTGLNFVSKTGTTLEAATVHDAVLSSAEIYPLWIGGTLVTAATHSFNGTSGTIDYASGTNTLTLTNYNGTFGDGTTNINAIETGIEGLKVILDGDQNNIVCNDGSAYVFKATHNNASIQFVRKDATSKLTMSATNVFGGFSDGKVTYDGLFYYANGDSKLITQPAAPTLGREIKNDEKGQSYTYATIKYALTDRVGGVESGALFYASQNPVLKYSFDYANDAIADVTDETYPAGGIKMIAPGKLTAWVEVGTAKSEESKGVRFGSIENPVEMEFNGMAKTIDFTLAPTMTNAVTPSVHNDYTTSFNSFATLDATNNKITIN
ncbi:MAG: hypothetical protein J6O49_15115, partial [Bacteroidaceae bacterium]|nr:hypothetical protein [Bacteroidaceae bacterium]